MHILAVLKHNRRKIKTVKTLIEPQKTQTPQITYFNLTKPY